MIKDGDIIKILISGKTYTVKSDDFLIDFVSKYGSYTKSGYISISGANWGIKEGKAVVIQTF